MEWLSGLVTAAGATKLTLAAFLAIAAAGICYRFFRGAPVWARMTSFFAILIMAFVLCIIVIVQPAEADPIDDLNLVKLLGAFPEGQRMEKCLLLRPAAKCQVLTSAIAGLNSPPASAEIQTAATKAIETNTAPAELIAKVSAPIRASGTQIVSLGKSNGYDVDVFWCQGPAAQGNRANAESIAAQLSAQKSLAPDFPVGRVRVRTIAPDMKNSATYAAYNMGIGAEDNERAQGERLAAFANSVVGGSDFTVVRAGVFPTPYYLSIFVCPAPRVNPSTLRSEAMSRVAR